MPRPKAINPTVAFKVYLSQSNAARVRLVTLSTTTGRTAFGSVSGVVNEALDQFFKKEAESCSPPETEARIESLRALAQTRDLTTEEEREALTLIREGRVSAAYASAGSKAKKTPVSGVAVLDKLQALLKGN